MSTSKPVSRALLNLGRVACIAASVAATTLLAGTAAVAISESLPQREPAVAHRVDALLSRMTLAEKIGQLTQIGPGPLGPDKKPEDLIRKGEAGSVLWTIDSTQIRRFQEIAVKESRMHIPLLFGFDVVHGYKTVFPVPIGMASSWDPGMVEHAQAIAAREASVSGVNWTFAPMVDIARDARWGRMVEGAGEDPYLGAAMARAQVLGFQGERLGEPGHVLACVKHFAGYGAAEGGRDYDGCYIPEVLLRNVYLKPFKAAIDAGVGTVMSAYMDLNDVPASGNRWLLEDVLRHDLGFRGFVISDSWSVPSLVPHGLARDASDAGRLGMLAGVNVDMGSETYLDCLPALVASGKVPVSRIDEMVAQVLAVKVRLGLFEHPFVDLAEKDKVLSDPASRTYARIAAQRSMVLLRNAGHLLPLSPSIHSVALIGPLADSTEEIKGPWTAEGGAAVSVLEGLRTALPGVTITYVQGGDMQRAYPLAWDAREGKKAPSLMPEAEMRRQEANAVKAAKVSDLVILVLGERRNMCGEDASSATLALEGNQQRLLEEVVATGKPVVLVLMNGRPLNITWAAKHVPAILETWFPGTEGGNAIADVLLGKANPGGKLPVSWPRRAGECPLYYNHNLTQSHDNDPHFTSRYMDHDSKPLYPFGYGLSYTTFQFSQLTVSQASIPRSSSLAVSVDVKNTGSVAGDEVVQLYLHQHTGGASRPQRELKGFKRVALRPGETTTVHFQLGRSELQYWSPTTKTWALDPSTFDVWAGGDSTASLHATFTVTD